MSDPTTSEPGAANRSAEAAERLRLSRLDAAENLSDAWPERASAAAMTPFPSSRSAGWRGLLTFTTMTTGRPEDDRR